MTTFNPAACDLCGASQAHPLVTTQRAMTSDRKAVDQPLVKLRCEQCGLVRNGLAFDPQVFYSDDYALSTYHEEHYFYTPTGQISRSHAFRQWLTEAFGLHRWQQAKQVLEVGAGSGRLLSAFQELFPATHFEGIEPSQQAVQVAQAQGYPITDRPLEQMPAASYDRVYSIAVLEHVPSPTAFLTAIHRVLAPGGLLYLAQPTQDVMSYDVFFLDHLHHFGTAHLTGYAEKLGFRPVGMVVGHALMPNFSLHAWQKVETPFSAYRWHGSPGFTTCLTTIEQLSHTFAAFNQLLHDLTNRKVAAFGLSEAFSLLRAYTDLATFPLTAGLDDTPNRQEYQPFEFPVVKPEAAATYGISDVLLTMNPVYYPIAMQRMRELGLEPHPILRGYTA